VNFEWDAAKDRTNRAKHDVAFEVAIKVWDDPAHLVVFDRYEKGEERWHAIGMVRGVLVLTVIHAYPGGDEGEHIRVISARRATPTERRRYEANDD
jgi:uncharacterized protein